MDAASQSFLAFAVPPDPPPSHEQSHIDTKAFLRFAVAPPGPSTEFDALSSGTCPASPTEPYFWTGSGNNTLEYLAIQNAHERDEKLSFDEGSHTYYNPMIDAPIISVTTFAKSFFDEFDAKANAERIVAKPLNKQKKELRGLSVQQILDMWAAKGLEARTKGTHMHLMCEHYVNGAINSFDINEPYLQATFEQLKAFTKAHRHYIPFRTEWRVWSSIGVVGTIDAVYIHPRTAQEAKRAAARPPGRARSQEKVLYATIFDWKRAQRITKFAFNRQCGKGALSRMPDSNFYHYSVQLNMYRWILETSYQNVFWQGECYDRIEIVSMFLVAMHDLKKNYAKFEVPRYPPRLIENMLDSLAPLPPPLAPSLGSAALSAGA